jgi:hypothetical protein
MDSLRKNNFNALNTEVSLNSQSAIRATDSAPNNETKRLLRSRRHEDFW